MHLRDKIAQSKIKETSKGWHKQIQRDMKQQKRLTSWHKVTHTSQSLFITAMLSKDFSSKRGSSGVLPAGCSSAFDCRVPDVLQVCSYVFMLKRNKKDPQTEKHRSTHRFKLCLFVCMVYPFIHPSCITYEGLDLLLIIRRVLFCNSRCPPLLLFCFLPVFFLSCSLSCSPEWMCS